MEVFTDTPAATLLAPQIDRVAENALITRNRVIEAVWRLIVGNDTPSPEDGTLYVLQDRITSHGPGNMYDFIYKGEHVATVEEVGQWEYKYFLLSTISAAQGLWRYTQNWQQKKRQPCPPKNFSKKCLTLYLRKYIIKTETKTRYNMQEVKSMVQQMEEYQRSYFENEGYTIFDSMAAAVEEFGRLYPAQAAAAEESILNDTNCDWKLLNDGSVAVAPEVFSGYAVIENRNIGLPGRPEFVETVLYVGSKHDCAEYEDQKRKEYRDRTRVDCFTVNIAERQRQAKYLEALREYEKTLSDEEKKEIVEKDGKRYFKYILDFKKKYSA